MFLSSYFFLHKKPNFFSLSMIMPFVLQVPLNNALDEAAGALVKAWELYGSERFYEVLFVLSLAIQVLLLLCVNSFFSLFPWSAVIMFVIVHGEVNIYDQKMLEYRVRER